MKIGIAAPLSLAAVNGGVRTQVLQTAFYLEQLGQEVEFIHFDQTHFEYDLVHVFSASPETIGIARKVNEKGIKLVLSPVFYSNRSASFISTMLNVEKLISKLRGGLSSEFSLKAQICTWADKILPNTRQELELVQHGFGIESSKLAVIPNGVEKRFSEADATLFRETYNLTEFILFVGQAGAQRKNVRLLLDAAQNINEQVVIIGDFYDNAYSKECLKIAEKLDNVLLLPTQPHESELLSSAYAACSVFCLPSQFETPGIAAMEAALAGAKIVITGVGGTMEYFKEHAEYVLPNSINSLNKALNIALSKKNDLELKNHILEQFTWEKVAEKTLHVYRSLF
jgi:glycosyltransferase involved in cell wall biosynthesis